MELDANFQINDKTLYTQGYIFYQSKKSKDDLTTYWECNRLRLKTCKSRAITTIIARKVTLKKHGEHAHPPNFEESGAGLFKKQIKRKAVEYPEQ